MEGYVAGAGFESQMRSAKSMRGQRSFGLLLACRDAQVGVAAPAAEQHLEIERLAAHVWVQGDRGGRRRLEDHLDLTGSERQVVRTVVWEWQGPEGQEVRFAVAPGLLGLRPGVGEFRYPVQAGITGGEVARYGERHRVRV